MNRIRREIALTIYRWATRRERLRFVQSFERDSAFPASILFYHRVADHTPNGWSISIRNFERQMRWIAESGCPASLDEIQQTQVNGSRSKPMMGVTFDDGYAENCENAIPILARYKIPVTYFVATHFVESGDPFPHDVVSGKRLLPNSVSQIRSLADQGIQIGAHSSTHPDFGKPMNSNQLRTEIHDVRKRLQDWTGQSIDYFAFPFGLKCNISQHAIDAVYDAGFRSFVSAEGGMNLPGHGGFHLQRIHGDPGFAAFLNWLTFDPRKLFRASSITYHAPIPSGGDSAPKPRELIYSH